jgi:hypothetical protein
MKEKTKHLLGAASYTVLTACNLWFRVLIGLIVMLYTLERYHSYFTIHTLIGMIVCCGVYVAGSVTDFSFLVETKVTPTPKSSQKSRENKHQ